MNTSRSRLVALVVGVVGLLTVVAPPARAADFSVDVGESVVVRTTPAPIGSISVSPSTLGTAVVIGNSLSFTGTAVGVATVSWVEDGVQPVSATVEVTAPTSASASGTFTPVGAPGPCLLLTAGASVSFGDVQVGGGPVAGDVNPTLQGCAPDSVTIDVFAQAGDATGVAGTLENTGDTCTFSIGGCTPTGASFLVGAAGIALDDSVLAAVLFDRPGDFAATELELLLRLSGGIPSVLQGSPYTFDVTFTAVLD